MRGKGEFCWYAALGMGMRLIIIGLILLTFAGCGSDSGSGTSPAIEVMSPTDNVTFRAGDPISYELRTTNFTFAVPSNLREMTFRDHPAEDPSDEHSQTDFDVHGASEDAHDHDSGETNPAAREGHYHIYLDDTSGKDAHVTAWTYTGEYMLPEHLSHGVHTLRFELRDNNHVVVGVPGSEAVLFFNIE